MTTATYEIDHCWKITRVNDEFCRVFRCTDETMIGRDVRDLLRVDWQLDFRTYVARALAGIGDFHATLPMAGPSGEEGWFKHKLVPLWEHGRLKGYRATLTPHVAQAAASVQHGWDSRQAAPRMVWDFGDQPFARAS